MITGCCSFMENYIVFKNVLMFLETIPTLWKEMQSFTQKTSEDNNSYPKQLFVNTKKTLPEGMTKHHPYPNTAPR